MKRVFGSAGQGTRVYVVFTFSLGVRHMATPGPHKDTYRSKNMHEDTVNYTRHKGK